MTAHRDVIAGGNDVTINDDRTIIDNHTSLNVHINVGWAPEVVELAGLLSNLPEDSAHAVIRTVFERTLRLAAADASGWHLLQLMHELVPRNGEVPLLQQVSELAAKSADITPEARSALEAYGAQPAAEGEPATAPPEVVSADPGGRPEGTPCLLVMLQQDGFDDKRFLLSIVLFPGGSGALPQQCDGSPRPLKEIKARLRGLLPAILRSSHGMPLVAFAVPEELLGEDFDQWPMPSRPNRPRAEDYRLGEKYPVVVRDLDRTIPGEVEGWDRDRWESSWNLLLACEGPVQDALRLVDLQDGIPFTSLRASLWEPSASGNAVLALLPARTPASGKARKAGKKAVHETLRAGFDAGMPAAIWLRHPHAAKASVPAASADGEDDRTYLRNAVHLAGQDHPDRLRDLPHKVWSLRLQAEASGQPSSHPGRRLSLLWADPGRNWAPPALQLPPPSSNGDDL